MVHDCLHKMHLKMNAAKLLLLEVGRDHAQHKLEMLSELDHPIINQITSCYLTLATPPISQAPNSYYHTSSTMPLPLPRPLYHSMPLLHTLHHAPCLASVTPPPMPCLCHAPSTMPHALPLPYTPCPMPCLCHTPLYTPSLYWG